MTYTRTLNTYRCPRIREALIVLFIFLSLNTSAQTSQEDKDLTQWTYPNRVCNSSLRGLSVVSDDVVWASGSGGTWIRTIDGGKTWTTSTIEGASKLDFRDIHALDEWSAWVISAGDTCKIFFTIDGGTNWELQYTNFEPGIFFDGFAFWDNKNALAYGDPIASRFDVIQTKDGVTWSHVDREALPLVLDGEAGFAASGTGICVLKDSLVWIASGGGIRSRVFRSKDRGITWSVYNTPLSSAEGTGIFSIVFISEDYGVIVGGSYLDSTKSDSVCAVTRDGGESWQLITDEQPNGYRSCVAAALDGEILVTVGRTGSEVSMDGGLSWASLGVQGYYACAFSENYVWAVGRNGKVGKLIVRGKAKK